MNGHKGPVGPAGLHSLLCPKEAVTAQLQLWLTCKNAGVGIRKNPEVPIFFEIAQFLT